MRPKSTHAAAKYFVKGALPEGWAELTFPQSGFTLRLEWPKDKVPYFAALVDEGGWDDLHSAFLEPATASFDRPDVARVRGECSTVKANAVYEWYLDAQLITL